MSENVLTHESYAGGYELSLLLNLSQRHVAREAAFFVPHLRPDMRVLDCGCGPGGISISLARLVSEGSVLGIDIESNQFEVGRYRAAVEEVENVSFQAASVYALPFEDASFDAVLAHAVLYHLARPQQALAELYRVLKPGGVLGVRDTDFDGDVSYPNTPLMDRFWALAERVHAHHGGDIRLGRKHRKLLREAGFGRIVASVSHDSCGTSEAMEVFTQYWIEGFVEQHRELILAQGWARPDELATMCAALTDWGADPDAFYSRCRCEAVGWKP